MKTIIIVLIGVLLLSCNSNPYATVSVEKYDELEMDFHILVESHKRANNVLDSVANITIKVQNDLLNCKQSEFSARLELRNSLQEQLKVQEEYRKLLQYVNSQ